MQEGIIDWTGEGRLGEQRRDRQRNVYEDTKHRVFYKTAPLLLPGGQGLIREASLLKLLKDCPSVPRVVHELSNNNDMLIAVSKVPGISMERVSPVRSSDGKYGGETVGRINQVIFAVAKAHQEVLRRGVVQVDVKPGNYQIDFTGPTAYLIDLELGVNLADASDVEKNFDRMVNFSAQRDVTLSIYLLNQNEDISLEKKKELLVKAEIYKFALSILFWILGGDPFEDMSNLPVLTETQQLSERIKENSLAISKVVGSRFKDDFSDLSLKGVNIKELYMVTNVAIIIWLMSLDLTFQSLLSDLGLTT